MQRAEAAGYCERFCMKYHWRKSDFEIGSSEAMRKRTQATVIAKIWSRTTFGVFLETRSRRHRWRLRRAGIERNLVPTETIYSVALVPHRGNGHLIWLPEY